MFAKPFIIVSGTAGSQEENQKFLEVSTYLANSHWVASDTKATIILDNQLSNQLASSHNLIVVGGLANSWSAGKSPVQLFQNGSFQLGPCHFKEKRTGLVFTRPRWESEEPRMDLIIHGNSLQGLEDVVKYSFAANQALTRGLLSSV